MYYLIIGFGLTGKSLLKYLVKNSLQASENNQKLNIIIYDQKELDLEKIKNDLDDYLFEIKIDISDIKNNINILPVSNILDLSKDNLIQSINLALVSPGVDPSQYRDFIEQHNVKIISDIQLFIDNIDIDNIYLVTGTNGKSTVVALLHFLLNRYSQGNKISHKAYLAGNYGKPAIDLLPNDANYTDIVLELSSFQLELSNNLPCLAAACLNISPDHLTWHNGFDNYAAAKLKVYNNSKYDILDLGNQIVLDGYIQNILPSKLNNKKAPSLILYSTGPVNENANKYITVLKEHCTIVGLIDINDQYLCFNSENICSINSIPEYFKTEHNLKNLLAVLALLYANYKENNQNQDKDLLNSNNQLILDFLQTNIYNLDEFNGLPYRCELIFNQNGIKVYNDSKATNLDAAITAINSITYNNRNLTLTLILGGLVKEDVAHEQSRQKFIQCIKNNINNINKIIIFSSDKYSQQSFVDLLSQIQGLPEDISIILDSKAGFEDYLLNQSKKALVDESSHIILFSPGGASFDMFNNYIERGEFFTKLITSIS